MSTIDSDADPSALYEPSKSAEGVEKTFVLDGQQRIQTLHALFCGGIATPDGKTAEAYFDVTAGAAEIDGGDLLHRVQFLHDPPHLPLYRIRNLQEADAQKEAATIADNINDKPEAMLGQETTDTRKVREKRVRRNIAHLTSLHELDILRTIHSTNSGPASLRLTPSSRTNASFPPVK
jgi:hypothetical protein